MESDYFLHLSKVKKSPLSPPMSGFLNPYAEYKTPDSGERVLPEQTQGFNNKLFFCPDHDCLDPKRKLIIKRSNKGKFFFSHMPDFGHDIRPETLLHKMAIGWFIAKTEYELPEVILASSVFNRQLVEIDKDKTECEFRFLKSIIPDVKLCTLSGFEFAIEIVVTNDISPDKAKRIEAFNLPTLRIDLSKFYAKDPKRCQVDVQYVTENLDALLTSITLKRWVIPPTYEASLNKVQITREEKTSGFLSALAITGGIIAFIYWGCKICRKLFQRPFRSSKKRRR